MVGRYAIAYKNLNKMRGKLSKSSSSSFISTCLVCTLKHSLLPWHEQILVHAILLRVLHSVVTPHAQRERGKVIGVGVHMFITPYAQRERDKVIGVGVHAICL